MTNEDDARFKKNKKKTIVGLTVISVMLICASIGTFIILNQNEPYRIVTPFILWNLVQTNTSYNCSIKTISGINESHPIQNQWLELGNLGYIITNASSNSYTINAYLNQTSPYNYRSGRLVDIQNNTGDITYKDWDKDNMFSVNDSFIISGNMATIINQINIARHNGTSDNFLGLHLLFVKGFAYDMDEEHNIISLSATSLDPMLYPLSDGR